MNDEENKLREEITILRQRNNELEARAAEYRQAEAIFRLLVENSTDLISCHTPEGVYLYASPACRRLLGYDPEDLVGHSAYEFFHPDDQAAIAASHAAILEQPTVSTTSYRIRRKDGTYIWFETTSHGIRAEQTDEIVEIHTVSRDITERKQMEAALRESRAMLKQILDTVPQSIFWKDKNGVYLGCNQVFAAAVGSSDPEEIIGKTDFDLPWPRHEAEAYRADDTFVIASQAAKRHIIEPLQQADGARLWIDTTKQPLVDSHGDVYGVLGVYEDISERKRIEEALEKRIVALTQPIDTAEGIAFEDLFNLADIQHLQDLYARAFGVAALITRPDGTPITQPSNFTELCGDIIRKTPKGLKNCNYSDAMIGRYNPAGPNIQSCLSAGLGNAGASIAVGGCHIANWLIGQVRNETQDEEEIMQYAREIGADEAAFRAAYRKVPIMSQEQFERAAQVLFVLANQLSTSAYQNVQQARFIAERKQVEQALQAKTEELDRYFTASLDLLCIADTDGYFRRLNPEWETTLGYTTDELEGRQFLEFVHPEDIDATLAAVSQLESQHQVLNFENRYRCKDGSYRWIEWRSYPSEKRIYAVARDITERKQVEATIRTLNAELEQRVYERTAKLETANKELQSFAYAVSHDLKAPLRAISRLAQWLVEDYAATFDSKGKEMVELLIGRVKRMDELIDGVLEYSRIGRIIRQAETIDLNQVLPDIIHSLSPPPNIQILIASALPVISGDIIRIQQVFANLIGNAMKFMGKPQGMITISCEETAADWQFSVADNGPGIDPKYHDKIFQIFQTLQPRDEFESTGIGLSIVKKIVEFYGGRIWVESEAGKGSTFLFTFPKQKDRQS